MTTDDGNDQILGAGLAGDLSDEGLGTDNVESGNTKEALGVEDALGLEDLGGDGNGRVHGVGDDENESLGCDLGGDLDQALDDTGVDVKEIIAGHAGLACDKFGQERKLCIVEVVSHTRNASGDDDNIGILEGVLGAVIGRKVARCLLSIQSRLAKAGVQGAIFVTYGVRRDVRKVGSNTGGVDNIVESELVHQGAELEQEGQWLIEVLVAPGTPLAREMRVTEEGSNTCPMPPEAPATTDRLLEACFHRDASQNRGLGGLYRP